jgi:hypothetical protein
LSWSDNPYVAGSNPDMGRWNWSFKWDRINHGSVSQHVKYIKETTLLKAISAKLRSNFVVILPIMVKTAKQLKNCSGGYKHSIGINLLLWPSIQHFDISTIFVYKEWADGYSIYPSELQIKDTTKSSDLPLFHDCLIVLSHTNNYMAAVTITSDRTYA